MFVRTKSLVAIAVLILFWPVETLLADPTDEQIVRAVRVRLNDGRILAGTVNERTDESELWLHFHHPNMQMSASFRWDQIESANYFGRTLTAEELFRLSAQLKTSAPPPPPFPSTPRIGPRSDLDATSSPRISTTRISTIRLAASSPPRRSSGGRITTLHATARLAQWDADAEFDGLELHLKPVTVDGQLLPVNGTITATLRAAVRPRYDNNRANEQVERWSETIREGDFGADGAVVRLPFRKQRPDAHQGTSGNGRVDVRLGVPGHGAFDAQIPINIRNIDPYRDHQILFRR